MGRRYYCEFCEKSILADLQSRKKHNEGVQHQKLRAAYYAPFKDLATILLEEREKKPCFKYLNSGYCAFGDLCRNSHRTPFQIQQLEDLYRLECHEKLKQEEEKKNIESKSINKNELSVKEVEAIRRYLPEYKMPSQLVNYAAHLPPSLLPPTCEDLLNSELNSWG